MQITIGYLLQFSFCSLSLYNRTLRSVCPLWSASQSWLRLATAVSAERETRDDDKRAHRTEDEALVNEANQRGRTPTRR